MKLIVGLAGRSGRYCVCYILKDPGRPSFPRDSAQGSIKAEGQAGYVMTQAGGGYRSQQVVPYWKGRPPQSSI